jgi:uncharacterized protein
VTGRTAAAALAVALATALGAAETPPPPPAYFNDYAGLVPASEAARLDAELRRFDEETSTQIVVAIFDALPEGEALEDWCVRTAQAWRVGRGEPDNGAVLFVFVRDRKLRLEVGYGLEGALPDAVAKRIVQDLIAPELGAGRPAAGLEAGIDAILAATRGEYAAEPVRSSGLPPTRVLVLILVFVVLFLVLVALSNARQRGSGRRYRRSGRTYDRSGWHVDRGPFWGGGFGGGGFSGGGGSFGGGGASGSW